MLGMKPARPDIQTLCAQIKDLPLEDLNKLESTIRMVKSLKETPRRIQQGPGPGSYNIHIQKPCNQNVKVVRFIHERVQPAWPLSKILEVTLHCQTLIENIPKAQAEDLAWELQALGVILEVTSNP